MAGKLYAITAVLAELQLAATEIQAAPSAATVCPPFGFPNAINHATNPSFELVGRNGNPSICPSPCVAPKISAAANWTMHSDNFGSAVSTRLEPITILNPNRVPYGTGPGRGKRMLHVISGGGEGGVYQTHFVTRSGTKVMFQVWVYVRKGHVAIQANGGTTGPAAWSAKTNQWEELRVCTDGTVPVDIFLIYNEDPGGGNFYVDRAEIRQLP